MAGPHPPEECAQCGAAIPRRARACPGCGADERTGWRETSSYDGLDLPEEAWSDDRTPPSSRTGRRNGPAWYWLVIAAALLAFLILGALGLRL